MMIFQPLGKSDTVMVLRYIIPIITVPRVGYVSTMTLLIYIHHNNKFDVILSRYIDAKGVLIGGISDSNISYYMSKTLSALLISKPWTLLFNIHRNNEFEVILSRYIDALKEQCYRWKK
jgi:hypothetical protein